jgi:hypothetical protein
MTGGPYTHHPALHGPILAPGDHPQVDGLPGLERPGPQHSCPAAAYGDQDIRHQAHHAGVAPFLEGLQPAHPATAPVTQHHGGVLDGAPAVDEPPHRGRLPPVLCARDIAFGARRRLDGNGSAAHHHGGHQPAQVMGPCGPIEGDEEPLPRPQQLQPWHREPWIIKARVPQPSGAARQGPAHRRAPLHRQRVGLGPLDEGGEHQGERLWRRAPNGAAHRLHHGGASQGTQRRPRCLRVGWGTTQAHATAGPVVSRATRAQRSDPDGLDRPRASDNLTI